jgi:hypothetical protein
MMEDLEFLILKEDQTSQVAVAVALEALVEMEQDQLDLPVQKLVVLVV